MRNEKTCVSLQHDKRKQHYYEQRKQHLESSRIGGYVGSRSKRQHMDGQILQNRKSCTARRRQNEQSIRFGVMWREGYDYPSDDDEQDDRDLLDRADEAHEQQNDK